MKIKDGFVMQKIADDYVVVPVGEVATRIHGIIKLNSTGALLWELITQKDCEKPELVNALINDCQVDRNTAELDVEQFLEDIRTIGCLT